MNAPPSSSVTPQALVAAMATRMVLAVGDLMVDRYIYGDTHRVSPEAPVPILHIKEEIEMLGGVGNVVANLSGLGVKVEVGAVIGGDATGGTARALLETLGVNGQGLITEPSRPTALKTRFLAARQQLLRTDAETTREILPGSAAALEAFIVKALPHASALILSDYGKGTLTPALIATLIAHARKANVPVLVDPKGTDYTLYRGASVVTPNRKEMSEATGGRPTTTDDDVVSAARHLMETCGIDAVVATRSQDGMTVLQKGSQPTHLRTEARELFDVSGAGDTVIATLAAALAAGADLVTAAGIANSAAGLVVAKVGTAPVRREELLAALDRKDIGLSARGTSAVIDPVREAPLYTAEEAEETVRRWKARGLKVGFTNGCFDILHRGHVSCLNRARDLCDRLIVALNTDDSVRRLKGAGRPVNEEEGRAAVIAGLGAVDMVVLFGSDPKDTDKPLRLLQRLRPDMYFKGGDYTVEKLEETPLVRGWGGDVVIIPFVDGHSTTGTLGRLRANGG